MAIKKWYTVTSKGGLNLRESPSKTAKVLKILRKDERVEADTSVETPEDWIAIKGGGFVMKEFVK